MASITVRSLPDEVLEAARALARQERRSLNSELILLLETGVRRHLEGITPAQSGGRTLSTGAQLRLWQELVGQWEDTRETSAIVADIEQRRTGGREVRW